MAKRTQYQHGALKNVPGLEPKHKTPWFKRSTTSGDVEVRRGKRAPEHITIHRFAPKPKRVRYIADANGKLRRTVTGEQS